MPMPKTLTKTPRKRKTSKPPRRLKETAWLEEGRLVAGVDEVGRGAWAGPLVAAAVVLPPDFRVRKIRDSKMLKAVDRERLATRIYEVAEVGVGVVEVAEINQVGFAWALKESGRRALAALPNEPGQVLLDGHYDYLADYYECETIIGGDATELCIAAASVVAKVHRDALMVEIDGMFPDFAFGRHKGYGTPDHQHAIAEHGPCAQHRKNWKPFQAQLDLA
jgi:ribonuclease HII